MIVTTINLQKVKDKTQTRPKTSWNYKKANWKTYVEDSDNIFREFHFEGKSTDKMCKDFCHKTLTIAKKNILRGRIPMYKPFWTKKTRGTEK